MLPRSRLFLRSYALLSLLLARRFTTTWLEVGFGASFAVGLADMVWIVFGVSARTGADPESAERVRQLAANSLRVTSHVRSMYERSVLGKKFEPADLRLQLQQKNFDPDRVIQNDELVPADRETPDLLKLLDECFVTTWHSGTHWDVRTRSARPI